MKNKVRLFIGDMEVRFKTEPDIYYNYAETDLTNPTVVKNSYSKTVTIEGTPENNKIFGQFWNLERLQSSSVGSYTGIAFNASKKTPFSIYVNGEMYESGYVKLDEVRKKKNGIEYDITLYGGLGEFFYILSYGDDGNKLKLSDLTYMPSGDTNEFDFVINRNTVDTAWNTIEGSIASNKWNYINFAPAYNGIPNGFSADKAVINFRNSILVSSTTSEGTTYTSKNGWALANLPEEIDEWSAKDLRSWAQRPVIRMKEIIKACEKYANKEGYTIDYDTTFFNDYNPYWDKTWLTLNRLDEIEISGAAETPSYTFNPTVRSIMTTNGWQNSTYLLGVGNIPVGTERIDLNMNFILNASNSSIPYIAPISSNTLYTSTIFTSGGLNSKNYSAYAVQLIAYDGNLLTSNIVAASDAVFMTTKLGEDYLTISDAGYTPYLSKGYNYSFGVFNPIGDNKYRFSNPISLSLTNTSKAVSYALVLTAVANLTNTSTYNGTEAITYGDRRGWLYTSQVVNSRIATGSSINAVYLLFNRNTLTTETTGNTYAESETAGYTGAKLTKKLLLDTENSPCDYLLSYAKMFGLHFYKNAYDKVIHIMTRDTFYESGSSINIENIIDRGSDIKITPLTFASKWLDMQVENVEGSCAKKYSKTYGNPYGIQRINTDYNFDNNSTNLYENSVFKGAVECTEKGKYMLSNGSLDYHTHIPNYLFQGTTYYLYNGDNTIEMTFSGSTELLPLNERKYYDGFSKAQFRDTGYGSIDGNNVLLFFNGVMSQENSAGNSNRYMITDDLPIMSVLNDGKPCYICSEMAIDTGGTYIAVLRYNLPHFGRYVSKSNYFTQSLDFGNPRELFVPDSVLREKASIYQNYWKSYMEDMYNINSRVLECNVLLQNSPSIELFRKFYWFDNAIWRLNKITDWKIGSSNTTKVQFIKVQDTANYELTPVSDIPVLTLSANTNSVNLTGGSVTFTVNVSNGGAWSGTSDWLTYGSTIPTGIGDTSFTYNFSASEVERTITLNVKGENGQYSNAVTLYQRDADRGRLTVTPTALTFTSSGGTANLTLKVDNLQSDERILIDYNEGAEYAQISWTPSSVYYSDFTGDTAIVQVTCEPTLSLTALTNYMQFESQRGHFDNVSIGISQSAHHYTIQATADTQTYAATGGTGHIMITADTSWEIEMEAIWGGVVHPDFLVLSQSAGTGNATITVTCPQTDMTTLRQEYIYIKKDNVTYATLFMSQYGTNYFTVTPDEEIQVEADTSGVTFTRTINTNISGWTVYLDSNIVNSSLSANTEYDAGTYTHTFQIANNTTGSLRRILLAMYKNGASSLGTIWVAQNG